MNNQIKQEIAAELLKNLAAEGLELKLYEKDLDVETQIRTAFMKFFRSDQCPVEHTKELFDKYKSGFNKSI